MFFSANERVVSSRLPRDPTGDPADPCEPGSDQCLGRCVPGDCPECFRHVQ